MWPAEPVGTFGDRGWIARRGRSAPTDWRSRGGDGPIGQKTARPLGQGSGLLEESIRTVRSLAGWRSRVGLNQVRWTRRREYGATAL